LGVTRPPDRQPLLDEKQRLFRSSICLFIADIAFEIAPFLSFY
jgi:hypothetical protein